MAYHINLYRRLISVRLRSQLQYRTSFLFELFSTGLISLLEFGSLGLVFDRFHNLGGWSLGEVAFLYGLVEAAFGVMDMVFSGFDPQWFGALVRRGNFDQLLLRPINITLQVLGADFALRRVGKITIGIAIFGIALNLVDIDWTLAKVLYLPIVIISMVCFFGGLFIIGASITFWTIESIEVVNIFTYGGSYLISHPMHIYWSWLRRFFTYIVPAIFLNYYPALYFLDKPDPFGLPSFAPFLAPFAGFGILAAALAFWRYAIQHYQSTGT
ncbi:MAG: ABC-2 family transporter protein [Anaerolineales bacterium]|jgi:ABC-2 type transport system permease protein